MSSRIDPVRTRRCLACSGFFFGLLYAALASAGIAPEGDTTHLKVARPGENYRAAIVVRNTGTSAADIKIYQTDYAFTADGRNSYGAPGVLPRSNAKWLRLAQGQASAPAGGRTKIEYEVYVPDDARLVGTYWSTIMIEEAGGAESTQQRDSKPQLRQIIRHAVQVITQIGDTGRGEIAFGNARLLNEHGQRWFSVDMENTGERWLRANVWLELHDTQGRLAGKFTGRKLRTFPATSVRNRIDLSSVSPGKYLALLVADAGSNDLFGTRIELEIP